VDVVSQLIERPENALSRRSDNRRIIASPPRNVEAPADVCPEGFRLGSTVDVVQYVGSPERRKEDLGRSDPLAIVVER
jgi:hypothetical protein